MLKAANIQQPARSVSERLGAVREAAQYEFPVDDIEKWDRATR